MMETKRWEEVFDEKELIFLARLHKILEENETIYCIESQKRGQEKFFRITIGID